MRFLNNLATSLCLTASCLVYAYAETTPPVDETHPGLICTPFGVCEPCPPDALPEPFCKPFGNRRLMHCVNASFNHPPPLHPPIHGPPGPPPETTGGFTFDFKAEHPEGETPAWEACGRIVYQERADFYEFVACNVLFATIALVILITRSKRLQALRTRQLAARIGIVRNPRR